MTRSVATAGIFWVILTVFVAADEPRFAYVDLDGKFTHKLVDKFEGDDRPGNFLSLPQGEKTFENIKFKISDGIIQLGSKVMVNKPEKVEGTKVDKKFTKLHILHSNCYGGGPNTPGAPWYVEDDTKIGEYKVNYEDKSAEYIPIVFGKDVRDWWFRDDEVEASRSKVAWKGDNELAAKYGCRLRLYLSTWVNPKPDLKVISIDYIGQKEATVAAPFCVALTLEEQQSKEDALAAQVQQLEKRVAQLESVIKGKAKESPKTETETKLIGNWTVADSERTTQGICTDLKLNADGTGKAVVNQPEGRWGSMKYDLVGKELQLTEERTTHSYSLAARVKSVDESKLVLEYTQGEKSRQVRYSRQ